MSRELATEKKTVSNGNRWKDRRLQESYQSV